MALSRSPPSQHPKHGGSDSESTRRVGIRRYQYSCRIFLLINFSFPPVTSITRTFDAQSPTTAAQQGKYEALASNPKSSRPSIEREALAFGHIFFRDRFTIGTWLRIGSLLC